MRISCSTAAEDDPSGQACEALALGDEMVAEPLFPRNRSNASCGALTVPLCRGLRNEHAPEASGGGACDCPREPTVDGADDGIRASVPSSISS